MSEPLTPHERAMLPEHLRFKDLCRFSGDSFDQREAQLDWIDVQRTWLFLNTQPMAAE